MAALLVLAGGFNLPVGCLAGAALGRDVRLDGTIRQIAFGPALIVSGLLCLSAGLRNWRLEDRARGLLALALLGAVGLVYGRWVNPYSALALYGLAVYLSPPGRGAFRGSYWRQRGSSVELVPSDAASKSDAHGANGPGPT